VYSTIEYSYFEIVYNFNPLTFLDLIWIFLFIDERASLNDNKKSQVVNDFYENARRQIQKKRVIYIQS
jgi:hypothetical protein